MTLGHFDQKTEFSAQGTPPARAQGTPPAHIAQGGLHDFTDFGPPKR